MSPAEVEALLRLGSGGLSWWHVLVGDASAALFGKGLLREAHWVVHNGKSACGMQLDGRARWALDRYQGRWSVCAKCAKQVESPDEL